VHKPPHVEGDHVRIGWHADHAYWQTSTSHEMLTAWIALHDCDEEMGSITMLDGSHRWPSSPLVDELRRGRTFVCDDVGELERRLASLGQPLEQVPVRVRKGQVSFHHCLTFHGSGINRTDRPRITLTVHMQDEQNRYRPAQDADGKPFVYRNDTVCRRLPSGEPDYHDPDICPVIWRTPETVRA
jgi:ectoine hydroxylase-related dioxygenase (phytanoyl-CoA dioxygenase family)